MAARKKGGGGRLSRSEVVTVRLDPRLRYGVELAARKHRRTASSFIEWAVKRVLDDLAVKEDPQGNWRVTVAEVLDSVWGPDEADRFVKLALRYPELLSHEEQIFWKLVREHGGLWNGKWTSDGEHDFWEWKVEESNFRWEELREYWEIFQAVAEGRRLKCRN